MSKPFHGEILALSLTLRSLFYFQAHIAQCNCDTRQTDS